MLSLKRASKSRSSGEWSDDDYDVFDSDRHIGRISFTRKRPRVSRGHGRSLPQYPHGRGYAESREAAMADFKASWERSAA